MADHPRDHALIRLLYNDGLRVSEAVQLRWVNLVDGVANIYGKGGRTCDASLKSMRAKTRALDIRNRSDMSLKDIARIMNPILRGWINYYGRFYKSRLYPVLRHFNMTVVQ